MNQQPQLSVLVPGAPGRMGQMVRAVVRASQECAVGALLAYPGHEQSDVVQQPEGLSLLADFAQASIGCDVVIDFSLPEGCAVHAAAAAAQNLPIVIGTTGIEEEHHAVFAAAARLVPVFWAPNMSLGIALLRRLVRQAAEYLPAGGDLGFDIEILENHHRDKIDCPSGTALALGQAAALGRGVNHEAHAVYQRPRTGTVRDPEAIGYAVLRGGGVVGDHQVLFAGQYEQLSLGPPASSREVFSAGALRAAQWLVNQPPGLYGMDDFLA